MRNERTPERRAARKKHYENNKAYYHKKAEESKDRKEAFVRSLKDKPCMDCGVKYPHYVMDFDHREGETKIRSVAMMVRRSGLEALKAEIAKCDLVCSNCHRERTWQRLHRVSLNEEVEQFESV